MGSVTDETPIHSSALFNKYSLNANYMPGTVSHPGGTRYIND